MAIEARSRLGPYEILASIGAGGMGEVWKARDPRLDRLVAIKVSKEEFTERFEREARSVAALNHPNVCQLYDVGPNYLVFEYIDGEALKGPLSLQKTLEYAAQICDALDAAHTKKITHRDLKPANIMVTRQGVKLLDFGLAKIEKPLEAAEESVTRGLTMQGQIVGTLLYMSPEQLNGKEADARSDIFSFGCVLYEMLTGKRAFDGSTAASIVAAILERPAPSIAEIAPAMLDLILKRCLEKDPERRWQTARDLKAALDLVQTPSTEAATKTPARSAKSVWALSAALAVITSVAVWLGWLVFRHSEVSRSAIAVRFEVDQPGRSTTYGSAPAISPDGKRIAFVNSIAGKNSLWLRELERFELRRLEGTEGAASPFWSHDGKSIAFFTPGQLKKLDLSTGDVSRICSTTTAGLQGGSWSRNGTILFSERTGGIYSVSASGGTPTQILKVDSAAGDLAYNFPWFLPDGEHFLFSIQSTAQDRRGVYAGSIASVGHTKLQSAPTNALFAEGFLLYYDGTALQARPFDPARLAFTGAEARIADRVRANTVAGAAFFTVSAGTLAYEPAEEGVRQLTWLDRSGKALGTVGPFPRLTWFASLAPDDSAIALSYAGEDGRAGVWRYDIARDIPSRIATGDSAGATGPVWSPDSRNLTFRMGAGAKAQVFVQSLDGGNATSLALTGAAQARQILPEYWSRDGKYIVLRSVTISKTLDDIWIQPQFGERKVFPYLQGEFNERNASISPDGKWILYSSDETGRFEIYVQSFPVPGNKLQVSPGGGERPRWSPDGKEVFYISPDRKMMSVSVTAAATFSTRPPKALFEAPIASSFNMPFSVARDGRFLIPTEETTPPLRVVLDWAADSQTARQNSPVAR